MFSQFSRRVAHRGLSTASKVSGNSAKLGRKILIGSSITRWLRLHLFPINWLSRRASSGYCFTTRRQL
ncbi:hypothetical protein HG535_0F05650 [Zygotorulaspora mrakii]|uniref:Uncharacterized protein n=1 Tax=Zygotorulaspora mrakii TaxID=42260 RepID=A0A7H9B6C0_ZYGMR|nr:uncharacterized protein HG535_0F05650 [Zygotorulaspora mrakii]QLG74053.1 hypothetical protein HG535_0F05650 [Zygotorulaspora mrakii]